MKKWQKRIVAAEAPTWWGWMAAVGAPGVPRWRQSAWGNLRKIGTSAAEVNTITEAGHTRGVREQLGMFAPARLTSTPLHGYVCRLSTVANSSGFKDSYKVTNIYYEFITAMFSLMWAVINFIWVRALILFHPALLSHRKIPEFRCRT